MRSRLLGLGVVVVAALLPWTSLAFRGHPSPWVVFQDGPTLVFTLAALILGGAALGAWDLWLGVFVAYMAALVLMAQTNLGMATVLWIGLGAAGLIAVRHGHPETLRRVLLAAVTGQALYTVVQAFTGDLLWPMPYPHGTFGNSKYLGAFLAGVTPLAPLWLLPVLLGGVVVSRSWLAAVAVVVGLALRPGVSTRWRLLAASLGVLGVLGVMGTRGTMLYTATSRWEAWTLAASGTGWLEWLIGHGPGAWYLNVPKLQADRGGAGAELFLQPHSDVVGLWYSGGLVAVALVALWLWHHRRQLWASPYRGAVAAIGLEALAMHPFHLAMVAPAYVVVLGLATSERPRG